MKKILSGLFIILTLGLVTAGYQVFKRYQKNPEQIVPYPYRFQASAPSITLDAPLLIVGDRMGEYLARFKEELASTISTSLAKPIKIQSMARSGHALHRTLHELKSLTKWPQILIYQGASEEFRENKFKLTEIKTIQKNFKIFKDDRVETLLILYPVLSKILYHPLDMVVLPETPLLRNEISENDYLKGLETELKLFEEQLLQLVQISKDRNSLLILMTTPINLETAPHLVCGFTNNMDLRKEILGLNEDMEKQDYKNAFNKSSKLIEQYAGNAELYFLHGIIAKHLNNREEAMTSLQKATAYDCDPWRATEVQNSIIRKIAKEQQVMLFDFAKLLERDFGETTFFDEIYPQNLYYEKATKQLGLVIKSILKL